MTLHERSAQIWSILVFAAIHQKLVSYKLIHKLTGLPIQSGSFLAPIQDYCRRNDLPPLTSIVINAETGLPGDGFTEGGRDVLAQQSRVFIFDWLSHSVPQVEDFEHYQPKKKSKTAS